MCVGGAYDDGVAPGVGGGVPGWGEGEGHQGRRGGVPCWGGERGTRLGGSAKAVRQSGRVLGSVVYTELMSDWYHIQINTELVI